MKKILTTAACAAAAACLMMSPGSAIAAPCNTSAVVLTTVDTTSLGSSLNSTSCAGSFSGNDTGNNGTLLTQLNDNDIFGTGTWSLYGKSDDGSPTVTADQGSLTGNWQIDFSPITGISTFVVSLKASTGYSAFLFENVVPSGSVFAGTFSTLLAGLINNGGNPATLSHLTAAEIFVQGGGGTNPEPVPIPAALGLLITALGALGISGWRRRSRNADATA